MLSRPPNKKEDPRVTRTRNLILNAFAELLPQQGFHALTVQNIAEKAGVNRATFYAHFPDKYALLDSRVQQKFRQEIEKRTLNACHYSEGNLRALIATVCEFVARMNAHCKNAENQFESLIETQIRQQVQELLEFWLEQIGSEIDSHTAATAASWALYGLALQWSREKNRLLAEEYADQVLPLVASNLCLTREGVLS
ncbi:MAG: TetR/AcrR family transcriptional regulator [Ardenticatenaceae bacterium]|nr:TetR/AcrR family transcriptional regulator [Ardenticatenaceae bacterium]HBY93584.1 hypothetical protein [Chloroflexota bacterium]